MGVRVSGGLVRIVANCAGDGGAVANTQIAHILSALTPGKRVRIKKIQWFNQTGNDCRLLVGFGDRTVAGSIFRQVLPRILCLNGIHDGLEEGEIPARGNTPLGFQQDATVPTGSIGNILVGTDDGVGIGAATPLEVIIEVEEE